MRWKEKWERKPSKKRWIIPHFYDVRWLIFQTKVKLPIIFLQLALAAGCCYGKNNLLAAALESCDYCCLTVKINCKIYFCEWNFYISYCIRYNHRASRAKYIWNFPLQINFYHNDLIIRAHHLISMTIYSYF